MSDKTMAIKLIAVKRKFRTGAVQRFDIYFRDEAKYDGTDTGNWLCSMKPSERVTNGRQAIAQAMFQLANLAGNPHLSEMDHANLDNVRWS